MDYLAQVLTSLQKQTLPLEQWELLLIDNASDQPLDGQIDLAWHMNGKHVREEKLGLTHARLRGIRESSGETLVFVDDDNVLDLDYLEHVVALSAAWPMLGAFGGQVRAAFEVEPPQWTKPYWGHLAIRQFDEDRWSNIPCLGMTTPYGTGLCVRRQVAHEYLSYHLTGHRKVILDRVGTTLLSGGDMDLAATACDLGLGNCLFVCLKLTHLIPRERLNESYLASLFESQAFSDLILKSFRGNRYLPARRRFRSVIADRLRVVLMGRRERRFLLASRSGEKKAQTYLACH